MAFSRCRNCRHYNDAHVAAQPPLKGVLCSNLSCMCTQFDPMGDSPEGTDIYRSDPEPVIGPGYHLTHIEKGTLGELSKVREELEELLDAEKQGAVIMQLCEASDLVGALRAWLTRHHPGVSFPDLVQMADLTERAFRHGRRK